MSDQEITDEQLEALKIEAGAHGDSDQVSLCIRALAGDAAARAACAQAIADALEMDDSRVVVRLGNHPIGPHVRYDDDVADDELDAEIPAGWCVDYCTPHVRTQCGQWSAPLVRVVAS